MNNSTEEPRHHEMPHKSIHALVYLIGLLTTGWTIFANLVILVCFYRNRRRQWTSFSRQTCSMTISDLMVGFTAVPILVMEQINGRAVTPVCLTTWYLFFSIQSVTLLHVLGICISRNIRLTAISDAVQTSRQLVHAWCVVVVSWTLALGVILIPIVLWSTKDEGLRVCYINTLFGQHHGNAMVYIGSFYSISQGLTNIIYLITCARLKIVLRTIVPVDNTNNLAIVSVSAMPATRSTAQLTTSFTEHRTERRSRVNTTQSQPMSPPLSSILRSQKQVIVTIGILLVIFNVFTMPFTMLLFVERSKPLDRNVRFLCGIMFIVNSGLNPVVYATRIASVREAVNALFREIVGTPLF